MQKHTVKAYIPLKFIVTFLQENFDKNIQSVEQGHGGALSQAFFFRSDNQDYVIRINTNYEHLAKDKYAYEHFASDRLPIPEMVHLGTFNNQYFYAITKWIQGTIVDTLKGEVLHRVVPNILLTLDALRKTDTRSTKGFGSMDAAGNGKYASWQEYLLSIQHGEYYAWDKIFTGTFFEKDIYDRACETLQKYIEYCPEERYLVHGDIGVNMLCNEDGITGVIDWALAGYGDFLYDVAWLDFWYPETQYKKLFHTHSQKNNIPLPYYEERLLCSKIHIGLSAMHFWAKTGQKKQYSVAKNNLLEIIPSHKR